MIELETERLKLFPLAADYLALYLEKPPQLEQTLGLPVSRLVLTEGVRRAMGVKLSKMARIRERSHPWHTYWLMVVKADWFAAGVVGFKGYPNKKGETEIGYSLDPDYQKQGYMTEAVTAMLSWAFSLPRCTAVTAKTLKSNTASQRVLQKVGMVLVDETADLFIWRVEKDGTRMTRV